MKKISIIIFSCLLFMCSCSTTTTYKNQEMIGMNYNNITNYCDFWLTTDSICYLEDSLFQTYFMVDENSKTKISENSGYGFGIIQRYEEKIYMLNESDNIDEYNSDFELKCYDVNSKKTEKICSVKNCDNFLVLNESIYYLEYTWINESRILALKRFSINSKEHIVIGNNVISFGVIDNSLYYITHENNIMCVFRYDDRTEKSVVCGEFSIEGFESESINTLKASYTPNNIFLSLINYEDETTTIFKYSFEQKCLSDMVFEGYIDNFVSYDTNSYFIVYSEHSENSKLCMLNNKTDDIIEVAEIKGECGLFVGSDNGAYVLSYAKNKLLFYSNEGNSQVFYNF